MLILRVPCQKCHTRYTVAINPDNGKVVWLQALELRPDGMPCDDCLVWIAIHMIVILEVLLGNRKELL
jgi:hypothetical protein